MSLDKKWPTLLEAIQQLADQLNAECLQLKEENNRLQAEINEWHECARYDVLMEGPQFYTWDRSALDRCRRKYIDRCRRKYIE